MLTLLFQEPHFKNHRYRTLVLNLGCVEITGGIFKNINAWVPFLEVTVQFIWSMGQILRLFKKTSRVILMCSQD